MTGLLTLGRLRQADGEFRASLNYTVEKKIDTEHGGLNRNPPFPSHHPLCTL